jgi:hypothetical protein
MASGIQFTNYVPQFLTGVNSPSPTLAAEVVTGAPISTGAFPGNCFFLSEQQANQLSNANICHAGWYMVAQVDAGATAANIVLGAVGHQSTVAGSNTAPGALLVTTADKGIALGVCPVVFLGVVTPGNYTIVQVAGDGVLLLAANQTGLVGSMLAYASPGSVSVSTTIAAGGAGIARKALTTPAALTLSAVAAASAGSTVYTGTITGGAANAFAGLQFVITGFASPANNGTFVATASTATTLTLANANGVAVTAAGTATAQGLVRAEIAFPFGLL